MKTPKLISRVLILCFLISADVLASQVPATEAESGGSLFSGTFADALWTVLAFILLLVLLGKVAWKPILNNLMTREEHIREEIETAENARMKAEKNLENSNQEGLQIIKQATEQAQKHAEELEERARQEAISIRHRAEDDIRLAEKDFLSKLWEQTGDVVIAVGKEVLGRSVTKEDNQRLIDEAIEKLKKEKIV